MNEIDKILEAREKVLWTGNPQFWPFFLSSFGAVLFGLLFLLAGAWVLFTSLITGNYLMLLFPHFWIGLIIVIGVPLYTILVYKHTHYSITNKRIIFQGGLIGRDFRVVDFDQVSNAEVNVGIVDKIFGKNSGSIFVFSAGTGSLYDNRGGKVPYNYLLSHITDPYKVFKFFKKVSHDVKTDIHYPNKYRPKSNPGYGTNYKA